MSAPFGNCPVCGKETIGVHIAGSVYDFQCDDCVAQADKDFRRFVDHVVAQALSDPTPEHTEERTA